MSVSKKQNLSGAPESLPQENKCRKAPLPRVALKPTVAEQAERLWQEVIQVLLVAGKVSKRPATTVAAARILGRHEGGGGEQPIGQDARQLVERLQALIMENEAATELAVQAVGQLSWEQLQTVQVVLDKMGFELLSDFVHIAAYNSSDPLAKVPVAGALAASATPWAHKSYAKQGAQAAGYKDQKQAHDESVKPMLPLLNYIWKADLWMEQQQRRLAALSDMARYPQILAGKDWHTQLDSAAEAAGAVAGHAGTCASVSGPHHNTWQRASIVAGAHRASVLQRFGAPRESVVAALPATLSPDPSAFRPDLATSASTRGVHHHSYTGLSYAAWHPVPTSNAVGEAGATGTPPSASLQNPRRFSAAFDGSPGGAFAMPLAAPAAPTLDAVFLTKGPGSYLLKGAQVTRSMAPQAVVDLKVTGSSAEQGT